MFTHILYMLCIICNGLALGHHKKGETETELKMQKSEFIYTKIINKEFGQKWRFQNKTGRETTAHFNLTNTKLTKTLWSAGGLLLQQPGETWRERTISKQVHL